MQLLYSGSLQQRQKSTEERSYYYNANYFAQNPGEFADRIVAIPEEGRSYIDNQWRGYQQKPDVLTWADVSES